MGASQERKEWTAYTQEDDDKIIRLRYREHLSVQKIGKMLGRAHGSINSRLHHPNLLARIPEDIRVAIAIEEGKHRTLNEAGGLTPTPPKPPMVRISDRPDVVVRYMQVQTFWRTRIIPITLPRVRCLEEA